MQRAAEKQHVDQQTLAVALVQYAVRRHASGTVLLDEGETTFYVN